MSRDPNREIHLDDVDGISQVAKELSTHGRVGFVFAARGTRFDLVLLRGDWLMNPQPMIGDNVLVSVVNFRRCWIFRLGGCHPGYVHEKFDNMTRVDAENICALFRKMATVPKE